MREESRQANPSAPLHKTIILFLRTRLAAQDVAEAGLMERSLLLRLARLIPLIRSFQISSSAGLSAAPTLDTLWRGATSNRRFVFRVRVEITLDMRLIAALSTSTTPHAPNTLQNKQHFSQKEEEQSSQNIVCCQRKMATWAKSNCTIFANDWSGIWGYRLLGAENNNFRHLFDTNMQLIYHRCGNSSLTALLTRWAKTEMDRSVLMPK